MATVVTLKSPQAVLDYLNTIVFPTVGDIVDKGGKYTLTDEVSPGVFTVITYDGEDTLSNAIDAAVAIKNVVPKKPGGKFLFWSPGVPTGATNNYNMTIASDATSLETALNAVTGIVTILPHLTKTIIIHA